MEAETMKAEISVFSFHVSSFSVAGPFSAAR
jgi:hypothetical protein